MLILVALLLAWIVSLIGWSELILILLDRIGVRRPAGYDVLQPILVLPFLTSLTILLNFFMPIRAEAAALILGIGAGIFVARVSNYLPVLRQPVWLAAGALWLFAVSTAAPGHPLNGDSGFYHLPSIRWVAMEIQPLGNANFFSRLGYNSTWFPLSALFSQVSSPDSGIFVALATETLVSLFGLIVLFALRETFRARTVRPENLFLMVCALAGVTALVVDNVSSASTDLPVLVLALLLVYVALRAGTNPPEHYEYNLWLTWLLTLAIVTIKVSASPLLLLPLALLALGVRAQWLPLHSWRRIALVWLGTASLVLVPWLIRGVMTSGCFLFPLAQSCIWDLPWAVTPQLARLEAVWIASWARTPRVVPDVVLASWDWLGPWFWRTVLSQNFLIPFAALLLGLLLLAFTRGRGRPIPRGIVWIILAVMFVGGVYWFLSAPDLRFGVTWFWVPGLLVLTLGLWSALAETQAPRAFRLAMSALFLAMCIAVAIEGVSFAQYIHVSYKRMLITTTPRPQPHFETKETVRGDKANVAVACWWTALCTTYFDPHVVFVRLPDTRYYFYRAP